jgi:hypothetical protein
MMRSKSSFQKVCRTGAIFLALSCAVAGSAVSAECNDQALAAQIASRWQSKITGAKGICQTATVTMAMLEDSKSAFRACLHGKALEDVIAALDRNIAQWRQTKADACVR